MAEAIRSGSRQAAEGNGAHHAGCVPRGLGDGPGEVSVGGWRRDVDIRLRAGLPGAPGGDGSGQRRILPRRTGTERRACAQGDGGRRRMLQQDRAAVQVCELAHRLPLAAPEDAEGSGGGSGHGRSGDSREPQAPRARHDDASPLGGGGMRVRRGGARRGGAHAPQLRLFADQPLRVLSRRGRRLQPSPGFPDVKAA